MYKKNAWLQYSAEETEQVMNFAKSYCRFLDLGKTERECVRETIAAAEQAGFINLKDRIAAGQPLQAGEKLYIDQMGKAVMLFVIGSQPLEKGINIVGAHIDSPRLDLKQNPLYEEGGFAYADTHYYGGIKKYQWLTRELAMHGVVAKKDGTLLEIVIGENDDDPVVGITDILPHLGMEQSGKKVSEAFPGEKLDIMLCGMPLKDEKENPVKAMLLKILKERYDIEEEDFLSAEIEVVPAGKAKDFGLDRSMVLGYGHDDRVCAYSSLEAILSLTDIPERTACCMLVDKEEIGSVGATGMQAHYFENAMAELIALEKAPYSDLTLRRALANSAMLSCDVSAGLDPLYDSVFEKKNSAYLGNGVCYNKFTGSRGKSGSNDANAEFLGRIRALMDDNNIVWQTAELGKVDAGGGGTIAYICALYGMEVIDSGVAVLSMHAPMEVISKADLYEAYKAYKAFMEKMN